MFEEQKALLRRASLFSILEATALAHDLDSARSRILAIIQAKNVGTSTKTRCR